MQNSIHKAIASLDRLYVMLLFRFICIVMKVIIWPCGIYF